MSELGELFHEKRIESQLRRKHNRTFSAELLTANSIAYYTNNAGVHLIVHHVPMIDFWPGTGKWLVRGAGNPKGRGVRSLINFLKK